MSNNFFYMGLIFFICIGLMYIIEKIIKYKMPNIGKDNKKVRIVRAIELFFLSPFMAVGMLYARGDSIKENFWFIFILMVGFLGISIKNYYEYKKTCK